MKKFESDHELDQLFRSAANNTAAPVFQESFWDEMEAMLPKKKRKKGFLWWWIGGGFSAAAVIVTVGVWSLSSSNTQPINTAKISRNDSAESSFPLSVTASTKTPMETTTVAENGKKVVPLQSLTQNSSKTNRKKQQLLNQDFDQPISTETGEMNAQNTEENKINETVDKEAIQFLGKLPLSTTLFIKQTNFEVKQSANWYAEMGFGVGQSYVKTDNGLQMMSFTHLGAGFYSRKGSLLMSAGIGLKASFPGNISSIKSNDSTQQTFTSFKGVYGFEFPIALTYGTQRWDFGVGLTPGIQMLFNGQETETQNGVVVRDETIVKLMPNQQAATLQLNAQMGYSLNENWQLRLKTGADILRPFDNSSFQTTGVSRSFPLHVGVGLRRVF